MLTSYPACQGLTYTVRFVTVVLPLLAGDYCEADYDGCQDNPCTAGTNCTDLTAAEEVSTGRQYNCSECPPGTKKDGDACYRKYC